MDKATIFTTCAITLYVAHHIGDYWVQSDHDARHKGDAGATGRRACTNHVLSYLFTQSVLLLIVASATGAFASPRWLIFPALAVSGLTHWTADRREHGLLFWLAWRLPGKAAFLRLGQGRGGHYDDNPTLGTGAWALDQAWHIAFSVFVPALILAL